MWAKHISLKSSNPCLQALKTSARVASSYCPGDDIAFGDVNDVIALMVASEANVIGTPRQATETTDT